MKSCACCAVLVVAAVAAVASVFGASQSSQDPVEFELMTWPEVHRALHEQGKTTALVYNGGTEQRGPQNVNGGHTLMGRETVRAIAQKLGHAIAAPVMPFSVNSADPALPGTIGLSSMTFTLVNQEVAEQLIKNGFTTVVLMGDHGGGQVELKDLAAALDGKYAPQHVRVYYCGDVYAKANKDFDAWLASKGYPPSSHGGLPDTSEMLYLEGSRGWVRKGLVPVALGDPVLPEGQTPDTSAKLLNNGITGDGRRSSAELGQRLFEMKVDYAVAQIRQLLASGH